MPIDSSSVGQTTEPVQHEVDARWLMAYAAGLGDFNPRYLDTAAGAVTAHPVFPVCLEWPAILASRHLPGYQTLSPQESARGVHAAHDLHLLRPIRPGDRLTTQATVVGVRRIKPGAAVTTRLDTRDGSGELVCRTYQLSISRGVEVTGAAVGPDPDVPEPPALPPEGHGMAGREWPLPVAEGAAHIYTECARIFNPIHTDRAVALAAGLPDIILHGTATLALAVSRLVNELLDGDPTRVQRLGGRFSAMVPMPSTLRLTVRPGPGMLAFQVLTEAGAEAVGGGFVVYR